ncbi:ABC-three component system protein [Brevundimonas sp.]|uniref:ABC-three component system protein n=1 Tax=Brevundimonas sp. TaxID=1871086 RepID=UPI003D0E4125
MTTPKIPDFEDWLDLCRDPAHDGLYFLGPRQSRITFYSQQVRALRLVHALAGTGLLQPKEKVGVVGAGAAGTTAALALALAGAEVIHYSNTGGGFQLQSASPRLLHPHVYEWPELGSLDPRAGLPILDWTADTAGKVVEGLSQQFAAAKVHLKSSLVSKSGTLQAVVPTARGWDLTFSGAALPVSFAKVVLAMGFGEEAALPGAATLGYWSPGSISAAAIEAAPEVTYMVSGAGDGGLTDLMSLLISDFQHVAFAEEVLGRFTGDALTRAAEAAFAGKTLDDDLESAFDAQLRPALGQAELSAWLQTRLRADRRLILNSVGPVFAFGRAARLNQVLAYAVLEAAKDAGREVGRTQGAIDSISVHSKGRSVAFASGAPAAVVADRAIVRHGPETAACYSCAATPFEAYLAHMQTTLGAKPELSVPPRLDPQTFKFFDERRISALVQGPQAVDQSSAAARGEATVVIGVDMASQRLFERGRVSLAEIAERCERADPCEVHMACPPSKFPEAEALVRLAMASAGRITLSADAAVQPKWFALSALIKAQPPPVAGFRPVAMPALDLEGDIDACLLRLMDQGLATVVASEKVPGVGAISPDIASGLSATWLAWRTALVANPVLRSRFLRWLYSVDPSGRTPWTGDHTSSPDLVAALVYMLATHLGEKLHPGSPIRGNLELVDRGVALGSGCRSLANEELRDRSDAAQWGVEALILAGTSEVDIVEPFDRLGADADSGSLRAARQVKPALIQNSRAWSRRLAAGLSEWTSAVEGEFAAMRKRQTDALLKVTKP